MLKVMGKGRRKVSSDVHVQRLSNFEHLLRLQEFSVKYQSLQRYIFVIISCLVAPGL